MTSVSDLVHRIDRVAGSLATTDLRPGPQVDRAFTELVGLSLDLRQPESGAVLAALGSRVDEIRLLCSAGESELESAWADRIVTAADPVAELEDRFNAGDRIEQGSQHFLFPGLYFLCYLYFPFPAEQGNKTHLSQIHLDGIIRLCSKIFFEFCQRILFFFTILLYLLGFLCLFDLPSVRFGHYLDV